MAIERIVRTLDAEEIDSELSATHFLAASIHVNSEEFEASTLDLTILAEGKGWSATDLKRPKSNHQELFKQISSGLRADKSEDGTAHRIQLTAKADKLQVICQWKEKGKGAYARHQPLVLHKRELDEALQTVFETVNSGLSEAKDEVNAAAAQKEEFRQEAEKAQNLIHDFVDKKNENKDQMYTRFAALMNEKKQKIIELERELARAQGVAEPQAEEEDEEEDTEVVMEGNEVGEQEGSDADGSDESSMATTIDSARDADDIMEEATQPLESDNEADEDSGGGTSKRKKRS